MPGWDDRRVENTMGNLLRVGVMLAAAVVLAGGILFLARHSQETTDRRIFRSEPAELREPVPIVDAALKLEARAVIQLGLLLLIATPVARVAFSVLTFALRRDFIYVAFTVFVLCVLLYSLFAALR
jgi:uncharacterized membrane protein